MSDREKLLNLTREATAKIANHCANTSCEKCAKESGKYDKESGKCKCSTMEMFTDHLIANGVTVQKWIPVSESLPEDGALSIVTYIRCDNGEPASDGIAYLDRGCWYWRFDSPEDDEVVLAEITHWMPLPSAEGLDNDSK